MCSLTNGHDNAFLCRLVTELESRGHVVTNSHVAETDYAFAFCRNANIALNLIDRPEYAYLVRDKDYYWLDQSEVILGWFIEGSAGACMEFEHARLLHDLQIHGLLRTTSSFARRIAMFFLNNNGKRSHILHAIHPGEWDFISHHFVDLKEDALKLAIGIIEELES